MTSETIRSPAPVLQPAPLFTPTPKAARRVLEFFTAQAKQRPHAQGVPERHPPLRGLVRRERHRPARRRAGLPRRRFHQGAARRIHRAQGEATPGRAANAVRLACNRPRLGR
jgi:hypothetical protein